MNPGSVNGPSTPNIDVPSAAAAAPFVVFGDCSPSFAQYAEPLTEDEIAQEVGTSSVGGDLIMLPSITRAPELASRVRLLAGASAEERILDVLPEWDWLGKIRLRRTEGVAKAVFDAFVSYDEHSKQLSRQIEDLEHSLAAVRQEKAKLTDDLALARRARYAPSSEKLPPVEDTAVVEPSEAEVVQAIAKAAAKAARTGSPNAGRKPLPKHLETRDVRYELAPDQRTCGTCSSSLIELTPETNSKLVHVPGRSYVRRIIKANYLCRCCNKFFVAPSPKPLMPGSSYDTPEFLATVAVNKYQYCNPLNRQCSMFAADGLDINRATLANLMIKLGIMLTPIAEAMLAELLRQHLIHCDETTAQVLDEIGRTAQQLSYLWVLCSGEHAARQVVYCAYRETRAGSHIEELLTGINGELHSGALQSDGYPGYSRLEKPDAKSPRLVACMAHIRRKFKDAFDLLEAGEAKSSLAAEVLEMIRKLYAVEAEARGQGLETIARLRRDKSKAIFDELGRWLERNEEVALPKSPLGKAIRYALGQWPRMARYLADPELAIDNNRVERAIRLFVMGRKNWLFSASPRGAEANAVLYSLILSARANALDPYQYLVRVLERLPDATTADEIQKLTPWAMKDVIAAERPSRSASLEPASP